MITCAVTPPLGNIHKPFGVPLHYRCDGVFQGKGKIPLTLKNALGRVVKFQQLTPQECGAIIGNAVFYCYEVLEP